MYKIEYKFVDLFGPNGVSYGGYSWLTVMSFKSFTSWLVQDVGLVICYQSPV